MNRFSPFATVYKLCDRCNGKHMQTCLYFCQQEGENAGRHCSGYRNWLHLQPPVRSIMTPPRVHRVLKAQEQIGWHLFMKRRRPPPKNESSMDVPSFLSGLIKTMWTCMSTFWTEHITPPTKSRNTKQKSGSCTTVVTKFLPVIAPNTLFMPMSNTISAPPQDLKLRRISNTTKNRSTPASKKQQRTKPHPASSNS
jgi:hypothetical protein